MSTVIKVENLSKRYRLGLKETRKDTLFQQLGHTLTAPIRNFKNLRSMTRFEQEDESVFWALRDINFEVKQGEVLGIIGHNGAGKSTLLKLLSQITDPTMGQITLRGRVAALLEVGTGFHQDLSGRENIYMNGTILGMTKKEIDRKLDEIVDFSGVEKHLDTPVKFYSSGMKVRLGFSVAAHLEPEILIIDEVLSVGDAEFQKKCLGKMESVSESGRTVLFVSHDLPAVQSLCSRLVLLNKGNITFSGDVKDGIKQYLDNSIKSNNNNLQKLIRNHHKNFIFTDFKIKQSNTSAEYQLEGNDVEFIFNFVSSDQLVIIKPRIKVDIENVFGAPLVTFCTDVIDFSNKILLPTKGEIRVFAKELCLSSGEYKISVWLKDENGTIYDWIKSGINLSVKESDFFKSGKTLPPSSGDYLIKHTIKISHDL